MPFAPKLYPAGLADRNSNSAFEKLKFIEEHYAELMAAYEDIMAHLKLPVSSSGGDCLWEDDRTASFVPYYVTFNGLSKNICDLITYAYESLPLYWVSDTTYAIPIPYKYYISGYEEYGTIVYDSSIHIVTPELVLFQNSTPYLYNSCSVDLYFPYGMHGEGSTNHAYVNVSQDSNGYTQEDSISGGYNNFTFDVVDLTEDLTPFTFNSIKPSSNKGIYLGVAE